MFDSKNRMEQWGEKWRDNSEQRCLGQQAQRPVMIFEAIFPGIILEGEKRIVSKIFIFRNYSFSVSKSCSREDFFESCLRTSFLSLGYTEENWNKFTEYDKPWTLNPKRRKPSVRPPQRSLVPVARSPSAGGRLECLSSCPQCPSMFPQSGSCVQRHSFPSTGRRTNVYRSWVVVIAMARGHCRSFNILPTTINIVGKPNNLN